MSVVNWYMLLTTSLVFIYCMAGKFCRRNFCKVGQIAKIVNIKPHEIFPLYASM